MTLVMGIVNVTPDSFSDGGRFLDADAAIAHGRALRAAGADLLDVGGESTRPGAQRVSVEVEQERVVPVIAALAAEGAVVSVDTMNAATAAVALDAGARIVNDVSGGLADPDLLSVVAASGADVVLQHWRGPSADMYAHAVYRDVAGELAGELSARVDAAVAAGIDPDRVVIDPGIGFGKQGAQNWQALRALEGIVAIGPRVLVGTSRKRFLAETLAGADAALGGVSDRSEPGEARRDLATAVTSVLAAQAGAWAVRVHDVTATRDALTVWRAWAAGGG
ncbi:MAG: dihydropteroate synthase [Microbacterium sp.]